MEYPIFYDCLVTGFVILITWPLSHAQSYTKLIYIIGMAWIIILCISRANCKQRAHFPPRRVIPGNSKPLFHTYLSKTSDNLILFIPLFACIPTIYVYYSYLLLLKRGGKMDTKFFRFCLQVFALSFIVYAIIAIPLILTNQV